MVAVVSSWSGFIADPPGDDTPIPTAASLQIPVANTGATGNWVVALCAWQQPAAFGTTVAAGDDGPNLWEPLGAPNGTTPAAGLTRCSIWATANPRAAGNVWIAPNDEVIVLGGLVVELSGLSPWQTLAAVPVVAAVNNATALGALSLTPGMQALLFTMVAADLGTVTISGPGGGWTALPSVSASNGGDHSADLDIKASWQVTSSPVTATWTTSGAADLSGLIAGVAVVGTAPTAPRQTWPLVRAQVAFGAGVATPWDQLTWTDLTARFRSFGGARGQQYELDTIQAGTSNWIWANNDGALTPGSPTALAGIDTYNPVRLLVTWPPPPAANARTYVVNRSFMERWPQALTAARYQNTNAVSTDVWSAMTPQLKSIPVSEILLDQPYIYAPLGDPAGSTAGSNIAPTNGVAVQVIQSKYGAGAAVQTFGVDATALAGDTTQTTSSSTGTTTSSSATSWQQTGLITSNQGYTLRAQDPNLPAISGGVSVEGWFSVITGQPSGPLGLITCKNAKGIFAEVYLNSTTGNVHLLYVDKTTGSSTDQNITPSNNMINAGWFSVVLEFTTTSVTIYVNGGYAVAGPIFIPASSFSANFANTPWWVSWNGSADQAGTGQMWNGQVAHAVVWGYELIQSRAVTHYLAMLTGIYGETTGQRIERLLAAGGCAFPRLIPAGSNTVVGAVDVGGQTVGANVVNITTSDNDLLFVNAAGYLACLTRGAGYNLPVSWTFGEAVAAPLNQNWSFAAGISPWTAANGATVSSSTIFTYRSPASLLIVGNGSTANPEAVSEQTIPVTPGVSYSFSAWLDSPQGSAAGVSVAISYYTSGASLISSTFTTPVAIAAGQPVQVTQTVQAPATAAFAQAVIRLAGTPANTVQLLAAQAIFSTTATEQPYLSDFATEHDPSQVSNDVTLTQLASPTTIGSTESGVTVAVQSAASMLQYGDQTIDDTIYLASGVVMTDLAYWIINTLGMVQTRISTLTLDPAANPALWPVVLGVECGQVVQVNRRLGSGTAAPEVSGQYQIMTIAPSTEPGTFKTTLTLLPYNGNVLTCDDPVRGVLDGLNRLGW